MKLGLYLRNMGPQSGADSILACARAAEHAGIDDLWVADHIAIPPDDAEGSDGRYLDPLATLAFLAGATQRIGLGTGVLVLPYRPPLATAKWIATIQELSGGRLLLGVGAGWMEAEFRAVGVARHQRGRITDETLAFLHTCFGSDEVEANGQPFLFRPRPSRPPIFVGGAAPHALRRAAQFGEGWMPMRGDPTALRPLIGQLRQEMAAAGKPTAEVVVITSLALDDSAQAADQIQQLAEIGATRVVHAWRYPDAVAFARAADRLRGALPVAG
jgi:probable F420-dependent oxidoreductase